MSNNNNSGSLFHQTDIRISTSGELYAALQSQATITGAPVPGSTLSFQTQMGSHVVNLNSADGSIGAGEFFYSIVNYIHAAGLVYRYCAYIMTFLCL